MLVLGVRRCTSREQTMVLCVWTYTPITIYYICSILLIAGMVEPPQCVRSVSCSKKTAGCALGGPLLTQYFGLSRTLRSTMRCIARVNAIYPPDMELSNPLYIRIILNDITLCSKK